MSGHHGGADHEEHGHLEKKKFWWSAFTGPILGKGLIIGAVVCAMIVLIANTLYYYYKQDASTSQTETGITAGNSSSANNGILAQSQTAIAGTEFSVESNFKIPPGSRIECNNIQHPVEFKNKLGKPMKAGPDVTYCDFGENDPNNDELWVRSRDGSPVKITLWTYTKIKK